MHHLLSAKERKNNSCVLFFRTPSRVWRNCQQLLTELLESTLKLAPYSVTNLSNPSQTHTSSVRQACSETKSCALNPDLRDPAATCVQVYADT